MIFVEYWILQEVDLAVRWGVRGVSSIQHARPEFKPEKQTIDPVTGETLKTFPVYKRLGRQALQIPFALAASAVLGGLIAICFGIEIFITEVYDGPFKRILVHPPNKSILGSMLTISGLCPDWPPRYPRTDPDSNSN